MLLGTLRPLVIGQNALAVERIWDQMYRSNRHSRASHFMMAISYIDNALWDLRGRHFGAPVFRLLGGPTQMPVRVYGSCLGFSIDPALAGKRAAALAKDGFIHQKWFLGYGPGDGARGMDLNVQLVKALRAAVGEDVQIMFDAYQGWDLQYALEWCRKVEQYRPYFVEEAVPMSDLESFIRLSKVDDDADCHRRTSVRTLGSRAVLQGRRVAVHPGGSRVVRRRQRDGEDRAPRLRPRRQTTAALPQRTRGAAHRRQPVAGGVSFRRVPHQSRAPRNCISSRTRRSPPTGWCSCPRSRVSASSSIRPRSRSRKYSRYDLKSHVASRIRYSAFRLHTSIHAGRERGGHQGEPPDRRVKQARAGEAEFRALYKELIEINTTLSVRLLHECGQRDGRPVEGAGFRIPMCRSSQPPDRPKDGNLIACCRAPTSKLKPCCCWRTSTWSRRSARTGSAIRSSSSKKTASSTRAAHRTTRPWRPCSPTRWSASSDGYNAEAHHQAGAHLRRGNTERLQRREVPHREPSRPDRCRVRAQRRRRRPLRRPTGVPLQRMQAAEKLYQDFTLEPPTRAGIPRGPRRTTRSTSWRTRSIENRAHTSSRSSSTTPRAATSRSSAPSRAAERAQT